MVVWLRAGPYPKGPESQPSDQPAYDQARGRSGRGRNVGAMPSGSTLARVSTDPKDRWLDLGSFIREQRGIGPALAAQAVGAGRDLQSLPEPDRAGPAPALGRDPPADRQGAAHLRRDALRAGRDPRGADGHPRSDPRHHGRPDRSARSRSRHSCGSTSPSGASTRTSGHGTTPHAHDHAHDREAAAATPGAPSAPAPEADPTSSAERASA